MKLIRIKNFNGAIEFNDEFDLYDLRMVMNALNEATEKGNIDGITEKSKEVSLMFENIWNDANKLKNKVNIYKMGISFGFGIGGTIALDSLDWGILSAFGFIVCDKMLDKTSYGSISDWLGKLRRPNHVIHIYDFKKKYRLFKN